MKSVFSNKRYDCWVHVPALTQDEIVVVLFGFNRPEKIVDRLKELELQPPINLLVSIDFHSANLSLEFEEILSGFAQKWPRNCGFKYVIHQKNHGLSSHITRTISENLVKYKAIIVIEDDISIGKGFINYMSQALSRQDFSQKYASVGGYSPISFPKVFERANRSRKSRYFLCWGWGTTRENWDNYRLDLSGIDFVRELTNSDPWKELSKSQQVTWLGRFRKASISPFHTWDIQFQYMSFLLGKRNLLPIARIVENDGYSDTRSSHTKSSRPRWMGRSRKSELEPSQKTISRPIDLLFSFYESMTISGDHVLRMEIKSKIINLIGWLKSS